MGGGCQYMGDERGEGINIWRMRGGDGINIWKMGGVSILLKLINNSWTQNKRNCYWMSTLEIFPSTSTWKYFLVLVLWKIRFRSTFKYATSDFTGISESSSIKKARLFKSSWTRNCRQSPQSCIWTITWKMEGVSGHERQTGSTERWKPKDRTHSPTRHLFFSYQIVKQTLNK